MKFQTIIPCLLAGALTTGINSSAYAAVSEEEFQQLQQQLELLAEQVDNNSRKSTDDTTIGGYAELHYNNLSNATNDKKELDLHRFVIFLGHEFNADIRMFSEFEIEHALLNDTDTNDAGITSPDTSSGEVEVEQAYIQFDLNETTRANAGVFLIPVGILNETHEPPAFYGVERNPVEKDIIPTTWWEGGVMLSGFYDTGFSYDLALTSGLNSGVNIRDGRQKVSEASANNLALTFRAKYTGIAGLELAGTVQLQDDMSQDSSDTIDGASLWETHAIWNAGNLTLTGLYARWDIDGDAPVLTNKDVQDGAYVEASWKFNHAFGLFVRQNEWDNGGSGNTQKSQTNVGFNYWPHEDVVLKADYQAQNGAAGDYDGFNLGIGYQF